MINLYFQKSIERFFPDMVHPNFNMSCNDNKEKWSKDMAPKDPIDLIVSSMEMQSEIILKLSNALKDQSELMVYVCSFIAELEQRIIKIEGSLQ